MMLKRITAYINQVSPQRGILLYYLIALIVATAVLSLPFLYQNKISFIDIVFVAASGLSVTGLSPVDIAHTFNLGGYVVLMFIMNIGGVGIMVMGTLIWILLGHKIGLKERIHIMVDTNQHKFSGAVKLVIDIVTLILAVEVVGAVVYFINFITQTGDLGYSLLHSIFMSVSATSNGGLDVFSSSLVQYDKDYWLQITMMLQIFLGSIGYPVLIEVKRYFSKKHKAFRFTLFTKVTTLMYGILFITGTMFIFLLEWKEYFKEGPLHALMNSMFLSVTSRSGGLTTVAIDALNESTQLILSALMFIGASPSSAGGGIRTTTFAILVLFLIAFSRGRESIHIFNRQLVREDINRAFAVISLAVILVFSGVISIIYIEDSKFGVVDVIFEVTSAFGTAGISTGITEELSSLSKVIIMLFMFIGRIGFVSFLLSIGGKQHTYNYKLPEERLMVG